MIIVPAWVFIVLIALIGAALIIATYLTFPVPIARLMPARAGARAEAWILIEGADGTIVAWPVGDDLPDGYTVSDRRTYTRVELEQMAQN
jgi:hypothetical protein